MFWRLCEGMNISCFFLVNQRKSLSSPLTGVSDLVSCILGVITPGDKGIIVTIENSRCLPDWLLKSSGVRMATLTTHLDIRLILQSRCCTTKIFKCA